MKRRRVYFCSFLLCLISCVIIAVYFGDMPFIRGFVGDVIVVSLIYFFIKVFIDPNEVRLALLTLLIAYVTELLQYFNFISWLGLGNNAFARIVFGSYFDWKDILAYTIGAFFAYILDTRLIRSCMQ